MALHTQQSVSGFIATEPQQSVTERGETRFYARIGQPQFRREDDGSFTELAPTFHDLVAYRATADRAMARFANAGVIASRRGNESATPAPRRSCRRLMCRPVIGVGELEPMFCKPGMNSFRARIYYLFRNIRLRTTS